MTALSRLFSFGIYVLLVFPTTLLAPPPPAWWAARGAVDARKTADDHAVANIGQLKHFASKAFAELESRLPGGAGSAATELMTSWSLPDTTGTRDDFAAANLGQLKSVAAVFSDRLIEAAYLDSYPWDNSPTPPDDFALANLGQLKRVFQFDVSSDSDGDGLPDWWENKNGFNPNNADQDNDGVLDWELVMGQSRMTAWMAYLEQCLSPDAPFTKAAKIIVVSGANQEGSPDELLPKPLVVRAIDEESLKPLSGVFLTFNTPPDSGVLRSMWDEQQAETITLITDSQGLASARWIVPSGEGAFSRVNVSMPDRRGTAAFQAQTRYDLGPAAPSEVNVFRQDAQGNWITWKDNSPDEASFIIQRSQDKMHWESIGSTPADMTEFVDRSPVEGEDYFYRVISKY